MTLRICVDFDLMTSFALWLVFLLMGVGLFYNRRWFVKQRIFLLVTIGILRGLVTLGVQPTLSFMGLAQVSVGVAEVRGGLVALGVQPTMVVVCVLRQDCSCLISIPHTQHTHPPTHTHSS